MKKQDGRKINQTFSIPIDVSEELHTFVKQRERSHFVTEAIRKELETKKDELRNAYLRANKDEGQREAMKDWESTLMDGSNDW